MRRSILELAIGVSLVLTGGVRADVITALPDADGDKRIALTFDACEAWDKVHFDRGILDYLTAHRLPFTVFVTGRFAQTNAGDLKALAALDFVEIGNHSYDHPNWMGQLSVSNVRAQVTSAEEIIEDVTGRKTTLFRFPAGNYDADALSAVEGLGYKAVHWRWPSGDPDRSMNASRLVERTARMTRPGDILIFHINGRGWHTGQALPKIVEDLKAKGYRFVTVSEGLRGNAPEAAAHIPGNRNATQAFSRRVDQN